MLLLFIKGTSLLNLKLHVLSSRYVEEIKWKCKVKDFVLKFPFDFEMNSEKDFHE